MYAQLWEEDRLAKCKREEMEAVMQAERNKETLKVSEFWSYPERGRRRRRRRY